MPPASVCGDDAAAARGDIALAGANPDATPEVPKAVDSALDVVAGTDCSSLATYGSATADGALGASLGGNAVAVPPGDSGGLSSSGGDGFATATLKGTMSSAATADGGASLQKQCPHAPAVGGKCKAPTCLVCWPIDLADAGKVEADAATESAATQGVGVAGAEPRGAQHASSGHVSESQSDAAVDEAIRVLEGQSDHGSTDFAVGTVETIAASLTPLAVRDDRIDAVLRSHGFRWSRGDSLVLAAPQQLCGWDDLLAGLRGILDTSGFKQCMELCGRGNALQTAGKMWHLSMSAEFGALRAVHPGVASVLSSAVWDDHQLKPEVSAMELLLAFSMERVKCELKMQRLVSSTMGSKERLWGGKGSPHFKPGAGLATAGQEHR